MLDKLIIVNVYTTAKSNLCIMYHSHCSTFCEHFIGGGNSKCVYRQILQLYYISNHFENLVLNVISSAAHTTKRQLTNLERNHHHIEYHNYCP